MPYSIDKNPLIIKTAELLLLAGAPILKLPWLVAQVCYETGWFSNDGYKLYNNYSGIKYTPTLGKDGKPIQKNAKPALGSNPEGGKTSKSEGKYAHFTTAKDWAKDYLRIMKMGNNPLGASDLKDFVIRLRKNKYFEGSVNAYQTGLDGIVKKYLTGILPAKWGPLLAAKLLFT